MEGAGRALAWMPSEVRALEGAWGSMTMSADQLVLILQRAIDRFVRRLRRGGALMPTHRRLLIVQIDGLSRVVLEQGGSTKIVENSGNRQRGSIHLALDRAEFNEILECALREFS